LREPSVIRMTMKFARDRTYSDPEKAARKLLEIASNVESHAGRI
jgi:hypothetical protein